MTAPQAPIVVPLDGSADAENALPAAVRLAAAYSAPLVFVHIAGDDEGVRSDEDLARARAEFEPYARAAARRHGVTPEPSLEVRRGSPAREILDAAAGARFIVIATHGRGGFKAAIIGSVADKVVRGADIPVLLVPATGDAATLDRRPILVALDGSDTAEAGLTLARDIAPRLGAGVALVRAYTALPPVGAEFTYYTPELLEGLEEGVRSYVTGAALPGEQTFVVQGAAASAILQATREVDAGMLVMTSHGRGFAARIALGSTTSRVLHEIERPLLVVPASDD
ncbi:MAG: universal stress protein [Tepidiformaceae bacterium]